jgi:hypothetical protein
VNDSNASRNSPNSALPCELHAYCGHVTIRNVHAITLSAHRHRRRIDALIDIVTENLFVSVSTLLFFAADVRENVVDDVE